MDTDFLRSLILVVERGSIAEAARSENLTPAAIGQRIAALEAELGCNLLNRVGRRARPTQACLNLLPRARIILRDIERLEEDIDDETLTGTLRLGVISTAMSSYLPESLRTLRAKAPGVHLTITPGTSRSLYDNVVEGDLDAALLVAPPFTPPKTMSHADIAVEPLCFLSSFPLARDSDSPITKAVETNRFIRYDPQSWGGQLAQTWLDKHGIRPDLLCDLDGPETIAQMVTQGMGVSILPLWPGLEDLSDLVRCPRSLYITPISSSDYDRNIQLVWQRDNDRQRLIEAVLAALGPAGGTDTDRQTAS